MCRTGYSIGERGGGGAVGDRGGGGVLARDGTIVVRAPFDTPPLATSIARTPPVAGRANEGDLNPNRQQPPVVFFFFTY